jgi:predicted 2-oxoglutarate/Fe(II)-dependent dioxygenase YbiX
MTTDLPERTDVFLPPERFVGRWLRALVSRERCAQLIARFEGHSFASTAMHYPRGYRDNDRLTFDDATLASELFERCRAKLPSVLMHDDLRFELRALNPRFRACRYRDGQAFCVHRDGAYVPSDARRSLLTLQLYLNDAHAFTGGHTRFFADQRAQSQWASLSPEAGSAIIFDHRAWHDGEAVTAGTKFVLRTDVLYERVSAAEPLVAGRVLVGRHRGYVWRALPCADGTVVSAGRDGTVRRWGAGQREDVQPLELGSVTALAQTDDGRVWCGTRAGWLGVAGTTRWVEGSAAVLGLAAVGAQVAAVTAKGALALFDAAGVCRWSVKVHQGWAWCVARWGVALLTGGEDGRVARTDLRGSSCEVLRLSAPVRALAVAADGGFAVGDEAGVVHLYEADGRLVTRYQGHLGAVTSLAISSAGQLASGGEDGKVRCWRGEVPLVEHGTSDFITSVAFSGTGALIFTGYEGAIWRVEGV